MAIYLGESGYGLPNVVAVYLGESGYGIPNVVSVYLGTVKVWPATYTVNFTQLDDNVCTSNPSYIGIDYESLVAGADFRLSVSFTTDGPGDVVWQGSSDSGQTWQALDGFSGFVSASENIVYMNRIVSSYQVRAVVDGVPTTIHSVADGGYVDFPPCEP